MHLPKILTKSELQAVKAEIKKQHGGDLFRDRPTENHNPGHGDRNINMVRRGGDFTDHGEYSEDGGGRAPRRMRGYGRKSVAVQHQNTGGP